MKLKELIRIWRSDVDDTEEPFLWSDDEAMEYANDAQNEAARRGRLLVDSSTPDITQLDVIATATVGQPDVSLYTLDPRVLFVRKARFAGKLPLRRMSMQDMESRDPYWEDAQPSQPCVFLCDTGTGKLRLWPTPAATGLLLLTVVRLPLAEMNDLEDAPELKPHLHRSLRHWMTYRACLKPDSETLDPKKAEQGLALFEQEFGKKSSAIDEEWITREQEEGDGTF